MLVEDIVDFCDTEYKNKQCDNCTYGNNCPDNHCDKCLHYIHTPKAAPAPREYDCPNMANFYTCKYSYKYMSELTYALQQLKDLRDKNHLKVMSVGCGPCTELFALDYLKEQEDYQFESLEFRGIDPAKKVWMNIHKKIRSYNKDQYVAKFFYIDVLELIDTIIKVKWVPDLIIFQYVFSDMQKHCPNDKFKEFISKIARFINEDMHINTYIVLNDINLTTKMDGGREHFDELLSQISKPAYKQFHFFNSNKTTHYEYGTEYESNTLKIELPKKLSNYQPFSSCASAQLIIKKVSDDYQCE